MVLRCMQSSGHGGPHMTPFMTILGFLCQSSHPQYWKQSSIWSLQIPGGISSFFSWNFPSNGVRIMSGDPFLTRVMTISIKTYILYIYIYIYISSCQRQKPATVPNPSLKTSTCFEDMSSVEHAFLSRRNTTFQNMANMENWIVRRKSCSAML